MESDTIKSLTGLLKAIVEADKDVPKKLKQRLVSESSKVLNPFKFIVELFNEGVLCDGSNDLDAHFGFKEMLVQLAVTSGCSKGADGIGGLIKALGRSGNLQLLSALQTWAEEDLGIETDDDDGGPSEPKQGTSVLEFPPRKKLRRNVTSPTELRSSGTKLIHKITKPTKTGLFAATLEGLISLDLQTLKATAITSESGFAVAVNQNLKKVYWSEGFHSSSIMRANFDGSAKEMIVPPTGDLIMVLAIDETSGNLYFTLEGSHEHEITVCNALGKNWTIVVSNPSLVNLPVGFAVDSVNGVMYWGNRRSPRPSSLVRANLDGSNAKMMSTGFKDLCGITLGQPSKGSLYFVDGVANTIGLIDVNGEKKRTLVKLEGDPKPWGIQADAHNIYFSNVQSGNIQSVNRDSGEELTTIFESTGDVFDLALFNASA